jgi:hypothetical protein
MSLMWFSIAVFGVWRVTHLLAAEDGPADIVVRLRSRAGSGFWGKLLDCFYCLSLWVAVPFAVAIGESWLQDLLVWPALSGAAILLERLTVRSSPPAVYMEHTANPEDEDVLLRR